jgi:hypothetical protein
MSRRIGDYATKQELLDLLGRRARGADRFDPDLMRACHPADATDNHGTFAGRMHDFIGSIEKAQRDGPPCLSKLHVIGNVLFELRDNAVFAESYHVAHETFIEDGVAQDYRIGGRYLDSFSHRDGRWLIQHRDIVYDWSRKMPATELFWDRMGYRDPLLGRRGQADPLYAAWPAAAGALAPPWMTPREPIGRDSMDAIQMLLDRQAIAEVLYQRARAGDRADAELAHTCYHPGATERHGEFDGLAADFIDRVSFTRPRPGSPIKGMFHLITNILVDFDGADKAFVESYHVAWCQMTDGTDASIGGRYLDRFERRAGRWAIVHRDVIFDWSRVEPETGKFWDKHPAKPFLFGRRGAEDPLYNYVERGR